MDLCGGLVLCGKLQRIHDSVALCDGNAVVIHHLDTAVIVHRNALCRCAGAGKAAGHRNIDDFLVALCKNTVPELRDLADGRLGGRKILVLVPGGIQTGMVNAAALKIRLAVHDDGHRHDENAERLALLGGDAAVGVGDDRCTIHADSPFF